MLRLSNISIPKKIYGLVGMLLLFLAAVSGGLIWTVRDTSARYSGLISGEVVAVAEEMRIRGDLQNLGRQMNNVLLLTHPPEGLDALQKSISDLSGAVDRSMKKAATITEGRDLTLLREIKAGMVRIDQAVSATIAIKRAAGPDNDAQARASWGGPDGRPMVVAMYDRIATAADDQLHAMQELSNGYQDRADGVAAVATGAVAAALLGSGLLAFVIATLGIARPLGRMTGTMRRLASGDLTAEVPGAGRGDEVGAMAAAVQVFKEGALRTKAMEREQAEASERRVAEDARVRAEAERQAAEEAATLVVGSIGSGLERLAAGDLTFRLDQALPPAYERLRSDLNKTMEQLQSLVRGIVVNTEGLRSGTGEISHAADDLSRRTEQQAAALEETAAALDEITASVRKTAEGAKHASKIVGRTNGVAEESGQVVSQAVAAMGEIERSAQQISQIIGVIDEIAFQTNLLALNAGVEAARAGDAGRGFAVVASEVRALAQRSAEAAREIKSLISASTRQVEAGAKLVGQTGQALARIVAEVGEISSVVSEIAASAQEQATGLQEVNTTVNQFDQVTQQNAAMVEQSTAASHALAQETAELVQLTSRFQLGDMDGAMAARKKATPMAKPANNASKGRPVTSLKSVGGRGGNTARKPAPLPETAEEGWTEF